MILLYIKKRSKNFNFAYSFWVFGFPMLIVLIYKDLFRLNRAISPRIIDRVPLRIVISLNKISNLQGTALLKDE